MRRDSISMSPFGSDSFFNVSNYKEFMMKVLDNAKLFSVTGGRFWVMPRIFYNHEWQNILIE